MGQTGWELLAHDGVERAARNAARSVASHALYGDFVEYDDMLQEARVIVATKPDQISECLEDDDLGMKAVRHRIQMDLVNKAQVIVNRAKRHGSYEQRTADIGTAPPRVAQAQCESQVAYTADVVAELLPAVWDESFAYGMRAENAPDADMPRSATNKATGNTLAAHIADIKTGWKRADLNERQRIALLLVHGLGWQQQEVAFNQGVTGGAVSQWMKAAHQEIADTLNGKVAQTQ